MVKFVKPFLLSSVLATSFLVIAACSSLGLEKETLVCGAKNDEVSSEFELERRLVALNDGHTPPSFYYYFKDEDVVVFFEPSSFLRRLEQRIENRIAISSSRTLISLINNDMPLARDIDLNYYAFEAPYLSMRMEYVVADMLGNGIGTIKDLRKNGEVIPSLEEVVGESDYAGFVSICIPKLDGGTSLLRLVTRIEN